MTKFSDSDNVINKIKNQSMDVSSVLRYVTLNLSTCTRISFSYNLYIIVNCLLLQFQTIIQVIASTCSVMNSIGRKEKEFDWPH